MEGLFISELSERMKSGDLSASLLVDYYLERIEVFDKAGPVLNAVLVLNPNLREEDPFIRRRKEFAIELRSKEVGEA